MSYIQHYNKTHAELKLDIRPETDVERIMVVIAAESVYLEIMGENAFKKDPHYTRELSIRLRMFLEDEYPKGLNVYYRFKEFIESTPEKTKKPIRLIEKAGAIRGTFVMNIPVLLDLYHYSRKQGTAGWETIEERPEKQCIKFVELLIQKAEEILAEKEECSV